LLVCYRKEHDLAFLLPWPTSFMVPRTIARYRDGNSPLLVLALSQSILHSISHFINTHFNQFMHTYWSLAFMFPEHCCMYIFLTSLRMLHAIPILSFHFIAQITFAVDIRIYSSLKRSPFSRAFSSVVRPMPGYTSQRRSSLILISELCCSVYCLCVNVYCTTATELQLNISYI
jgi:hypothetical protein